ncbi:MAG: methylmalonyl Co-A mutase-associated GTPase MeaB [Acidobacteria bacterium]|nr:methylmalonyl Co-A mutase-associated GTPase MeaB [Acidobacteriota bacterium]
MSLDEIHDGVRRAAPRALAKALTIVENGGPAARELLAAIRPVPADVRVIGITGPPGSGKSTLVEELGVELANGMGRVAVLAVDPSSPFSGGAVLGDRVRMSRLAGLPGCFVRSMATRGALGGLAASAADAVDLFAVAGFPIVLVETVGTGQDEVDVMHLADTVVLTVPPGLGDDVQVAKAGIMEIAHIFAVTKADLPGADEVAAHLQAMLDLLPPDAWQPPVLLVSALQHRGISSLADALGEHERYMADGGRREIVRRARAARRLERAIQGLLWERVQDRGREALDRAITAVASGGVDPYTAATELLHEAPW